MGSGYEFGSWVQASVRVGIGVLTGIRVGLRVGCECVGGSGFECGWKLYWCMLLLLNVGFPGLSSGLS